MGFDLPYSCPTCRVGVWDEPQEHPALTCVISSLEATLGSAIEEDDVDTDIESTDGDIWAGTFRNYYV